MLEKNMSKKNISVKYFNFTSSLSSAANAENDAFKVVQHVCEPFQSYSGGIHDVKITHFTDGVTNKLIGFTTAPMSSAKDLSSSTDDNYLEMVLVRIYGENTDLCVDRETELKVMDLLYHNGMGPPVYCRFNNGICYGFTPGTIATTEDIRDPKICKLVACQMAKFHNLTCDQYVASSSSLVDRIQRFLTLSKEVSYCNNCIYTHDRRMEEFDFVESIIRQHSAVTPVALCHNDLLLGNVIIQPNSDDVRFIDFEYAFPNNVAFDIGNHFAEWVGLRNMNSSLFPEKQAQLQWIRWYLEEFYNSSSKHQMMKITDEMVMEWFESIKVFSMIAHFCWATWGLVQLLHSKIDFDWKDYSVSKYEFYYQCKSKFIGDNM